MKKIEAVIRPEKLEEVRKALENIGYPGIMITEIDGHGRQKGTTYQWRGEKYRVELMPKIKLEIVALDTEVSRITKTIVDIAKTGEVGDGKIFVSPVEDVTRIRTGEQGEIAL